MTAGGGIGTTPTGGATARPSTIVPCVQPHVRLPRCRTPVYGADRRAPARCSACCWASGRPRSLGPPSRRPVASYRLDATVDFDAGRVTSSERLRYRNVVGVPLASLVFRVVPNVVGSFELRRATVDGQEVAGRRTAACWSFRWRVRWRRARLPRSRWRLRSDRPSSVAGCRDVAWHGARQLVPDPGGPPGRLGPPPVSSTSATPPSARSPTTT